MMKKIIFSIFILMSLPVMIMSADLDFDSFCKVVGKGVPDGFLFSKKNSQGNRFWFKGQYDKKGSKWEAIIFTLIPNSSSFSKMSKLGKPKSLKFGDRKALFADGAKTGMSTLIIILKNKTGRFSISHRTLGGKPSTLKDFKKMIQKIKLENLEK